MDGRYKFPTEIDWIGNKVLSLFNSIACSEQIAILRVKSIVEMQTLITLQALTESIEDLIWNYESN